MCRKRKLLSDVFGFSVLLFICLFIVFSSKVAGYALKGMKLCAYQLIPTVFPILVLNSLLARCGFASRLAKVIGAPLSAIFGISKKCSLPFLMGILCGAPSGAAVTATLEKEGKISKEDALISLIMSSSVSAGFIVGTIGGGLLFSFERGLAIWLFQLISCLFVSLLFSKRVKREESEIISDTPGLDPSVLGASIREALGNMLVICGSVIFFSSLSGISSAIPFLPKVVRVFLSALLEITSGCALITSEYSGDTAFILLCAASGWSGISMLTQTASLCDGRIPIGKFVLSKAICAIICTLLGGLSVAIKII